jgi:hypothetical protein
MKAQSEADDTAAVMELLQSRRRGRTHHIFIYSHQLVRVDWVNLKLVWLKGFEHLWLLKSRYKKLQCRTRQKCRCKKSQVSIIMITARHYQDDYTANTSNSHLQFRTFSHVQESGYVSRVLVLTGHH